MNISVLCALLVKKDNYKLPFDLSFHCFVANCFYFLCQLILEIQEYKSKNINQNFSSFLKDIFFKYIFAFNSFNTFIYYAFILLGPIFKTFPKEKSEIFFTIFLNGGQIILILMEFIITNHVYNLRYVLDSFILLAYFKLYLVFCVFGGKKYNIYPFDFMKIADIYQDFVAFLVCKIILINYYGVYQGFLLKKNEYLAKRAEKDNKTNIEYEMHEKEFDSSYDKYDKEGKNYVKLNDKKLNCSETRNENNEKNYNQNATNSIVKENNNINNGTIKIYDDA